LARTRTSFAKGNTLGFKSGQSGNPSGRRPLVDDIHALARQHAPAAVEALVAALRDPERAIPAAIALLDRGYGKPPVAVFAQVNGTVAIGGIDAPPPIVDETDEQWLCRRRQELAHLEHATRRESAPTSLSAAPAASPTPPPNGETAVPGVQTGAHASAGSSMRSMTPDEEWWLRQQRRRLGIEPERD
jgi:hypothetical protein